MQNTLYRRPDAATPHVLTPAGRADEKSGSDTADAVSDPDALPVVLDADGQVIDRSYFWSGGCAAFALQLARHLRSLGREADIAVISNRDGEPWSEDCDFEMTHVVVSVPEGYIDVNGLERDPQSIVDKLFAIDFRLEGDWGADDFERMFVGCDDDKPLHGADADLHEQIERLIAATPHLYGVAPMEQRPTPRP